MRLVCRLALMDKYLKHYQNTYSLMNTIVRHVKINVIYITVMTKGDKAVLLKSIQRQGTQSSMPAY